MIVAYIDSYRGRFGVEPICRVLTEHQMPIAPSTYYAALACRVSSHQLAEAYLVNAAVCLFDANRGVYGVRKLWHAMVRAGHQVGRDQVGRLMRIGGLCGAVRGRHATTTTRRDAAAPRHPDLIGRAWDTPTRPDQWWVADFTYVWTLAGFCYVAFLTDVFSRRILGWRVTTSKTTPLVTSVLDQALFTRRRGDVEFTATGLVHHSDAGSQDLDQQAAKATRTRLVRWHSTAGIRRAAHSQTGSSPHISGKQGEHAGAFGRLDARSKHYPRWVQA